MMVIYFRQAQGRGAATLSRLLGQQSLPPRGFKEQAEVVYLTEKG
jgi:hypothetical protein